jgi:hypothetical protein
MIRAFLRIASNPSAALHEEVTQCMFSHCCFS